ncbi:hypothetical protein BDW69DRAFT_189509 [Aspergillus filifer]
MKKIQSPGMVHVPWRFADERGTHSVPCWVLPKSTQQLILGNPFLSVTKTLTEFSSRIKHELVTLPRKLRLQLLGEKSQRLWGYLERTGTVALPDTGSDVMFISKSYADKFGLTIDEAHEHLLEVEFADGGTGWTREVVRDAEWTVGNKATHTDFYVLDNLCVDVILSNDYLFENNIFADCEQCLFDANLEDGLRKLCNIRLIGKYGETLDQLEGEYHQDLNSPMPFALETYNESSPGETRSETKSKLYSKISKEQQSLTRANDSEDGKP